MFNKESKVFCLQKANTETKSKWFTNKDSVNSKNHIGHKSFWHYVGQIASKSTYFHSLTSDSGKCGQSNGKNMTKERSD